MLGFVATKTDFCVCTKYFSTPNGILQNYCHMSSYILCEEEVKTEKVS